MTSRRPDIYAHRGSTLLAPENTAVAFDMALAMGADVLETDVRLSRDDEVMVTHDPEIDRTTSGHGLVRDHTAAALTTLDAARHFQTTEGQSWQHQGVRLLTLGELFDRYPDTRINIDIKDESLEAAAAVARVIKRYGRTATVTVGSFHATVIRHFRQLSPTVDTAASRSEVAALYFGRLVPGRFGTQNTQRTAVRRSAASFEFIQIPMSWCGLPLATTSFLRRARDRQVKSVYWTINSERAMHRLVSRGVDGIVTDRTDLAKQLFDQFWPATRG